MKSMKDYIVITPEMQSVLDADPVWRFVQKVNEEAPKNPKWHENYTRALYDVFSLEADDYAVKLLKSKGLIPPTTKSQKDWSESK